MPKLPEEFADLERFSDWCLPTEEERYSKRLNSTMAEMQELYDAGMARLEGHNGLCRRPIPARGDARRRKGVGASRTVDRDGELPRRGMEAAALCSTAAPPIFNSSRSRWSKRADPQSSGSTRRRSRRDRPAGDRSCRRRSDRRHRRPSRRRRHRSRGFHSAPRPDGHGGQPPDGRARREPRSVPGAGRSTDAGVYVRSAIPGARCVRGSPPCATSDCSSRQAVTCSTSRLARRSTRAGSRGRGSSLRGHAITPHRRAPRPDDVRCVHARCSRTHRRGGHRQRGRRDPQGGAISDQARRPADQGPAFPARDVTDRRGRGTTLFG